METDKQRTTRRAISGWLTEQENNFEVTQEGTKRLYGALEDGLGTAVRALVIQSLEEIDERLKELNKTMQGDKYHVVDGHELVKFYMKGGNAFNCIINLEGIGATKWGGGNSDWDTQIVIDPWAPTPIIDIVYGRVEDIVLDVFSSLGINIAKVVVDYNNKQGQRIPKMDFTESVLESWKKNSKNIDDKAFYRYNLKLDEPQTLRRVYDHDRVGLWMNDRRPLISSADKKESKWLPGMIFNDAIKPFVLYRLGYTWHADTISPAPEVPGGAGSQNMYAGDINKPILMELIDVTIPRRNTIESVRIWEELIHDKVKITNPPISVETKKPKPVDPGYNTNTVSSNLPLPDVFYHASELAIMLCEIADGSSRHADKMIKRFKRLKKISDIDHQNKQRIEKKLTNMIGVTEISDVDLVNQPEVSKNINAVQDVEQRKLLGLDGSDPDNVYKNILNMMNYVEKTTTAQESFFEGDGSIKNSIIIKCKEARKSVRSTIKYLIENNIIAGRLDLAYSDDLALLDYILENGYLNISKIGFSGVFKSVTIRVPDYDVLKLFTARIASAFESQGFVCNYKMYNTPRATRISYESLLVVFDGGKAEMFITLTTASAQEAPFATDPVGENVPYAPISDIANQRKVAAALIEDYIIGTAMSRQYEAIKEVVRLT